jgi:hypothetical protein
MKILFNKDIFKDIWFYYHKMTLPFRKIVKIVKVMYEEGIHFSNAKQVIGERKLVRDSEGEGEKWSSRLGTLKRFLVKMGYSVMDVETARNLSVAFPNQPQKRIDFPSHFTLSDMDRRDASEVYQVAWDLFNKGWSYDREYDDPTFYYYDKKNFLKWASHPREVEFDFRNCDRKRKYSRQNFAEVLQAFSSRRRVCSYEDFLDFGRLKGLVGGGKDGPGDLWDSSFSRGIPPPKPGYGYNEGFVFAELKIDFDKPSIFSLPVNCFDVIGSGVHPGCTYDFKISNRNAFEDNKHAFEFYRLASVKSQINVSQTTSSQVLINESIYKYSVFNEKPEFVERLVDNNKTTKCIENHVQFSIYTEAWKYLGCKEIYDGSYSKSLISGLEEHLFYNVIVDPGKSSTSLVIYFIFKVQFFSRFICSIPDLNEYYNIVELNLCNECDQDLETGDNIPTKEEMDEEEHLCYDVD